MVFDISKLKSQNLGFFYHCLRLKYEKFQELLEDDRIHFTKPKKDSNRAMLYKKLYKHESKGKPLSNLWDDISYITRTSQDKRLYPTQKPVKLLERIIAIASDVFITQPPTLRKAHCNFYLSY